MSTEQSSEWGDLPIFINDNWRVTDEDIEAWSDILAMRDMVTEIIDALDDEFAHDVLGGGESDDGRGMLEFEIEIYLEPWPADVAGMLLGQWRLQRDAVSA